jgi:hypothetical protein
MASGAAGGAAVAFTPSEGDLKGVIELMNMAQSPDNQVQKQVFQQLEQLEQNPEFFTLHLTFILCQCTDEQVGVMNRWLAGILLKTTLRKSSKRIFQQLPQQFRAYIMENALRMLGDSNKNIRRVAGSIVTTALNTEQNEPLSKWPALIRNLATMSVSPSAPAVEGAFYCLSLICEDSAREMHEDPNQPLNELLPHFVSHLGNASSMLRRLALTCIVHVLPFQPSVLDSLMGTLLQGLSALAKDAEDETRKLVCQALCKFTELRFDQLLPMMGQIMEFMLFAMEDDSDVVAMEACEFWCVYCEYGDEAYGLLREFLPRLIPLLMSKMVYGDEELIDLDVDDVANAQVKDKSEDVRPMAHKSSLKGDEVDTEGEEGDEGEATGLTLRKAAAGALDLLAFVIGKEMLPFYLPCLKQMTFDLIGNDAEWLRVECGILSLGAVADGLGKELKGYMGELFPFLVQATGHVRPLVRSIAVWAISQHSRWVCCTAQAAERGGPAAFFQPALQTMLERMKDHNKSVQEAAVSALSKLIQTAEELIEPFIGHIIPVLVHCHTFFQERNMYLLYDAISTLAESAGEALERPEYLAALLPPLLSRWEALGDMDRNLIPILETLASIGPALKGEQFVELGTSIFGRCLGMIETVLAVVPANVDDETDTDFLVTALDVLAGLAEGLGPHFPSLVTASNLVELLPHCIALQHLNSARQSTYALVGEMSKFCIAPMASELPGIIEQMLGDICYDTGQDAEYSIEDSNQNDCCNNAIWALGKIGKVVGGPSMEPNMASAMEKIGRAIVDQWAPTEIRINGAATMAQFALVCPETVSRMIEPYFPHFCLQLMKIRHKGEVTDGYKGLCVVLQANPQLGIRNFRFFAHAIVEGGKKGLPNEINQVLKKLLYGIQQNQGANWDAFLSESGLHPAIQNKLAAFSQS